MDSTVKNKEEFINTYIPASQTIPAGGYDPKACVSVAKLDLSNASPSGMFYLACGLVGFRLTNPVFTEEGVKKVKEIRISLVDTESSEHVHLAGNAKIDVSTPSVPRITYGLYNAHSITLKSASGYFEDNQMYYICLPELNNVPVNFSFILENDKFYNRKVYISSVRAVKDAFDGVLELEAEYFTATQTTDISTVEQFITWYSNPAAIYGTVNIIKDLDFSSVQTDALKCHDFYGTFNGNGKTLKGLKIQPSTDGMVGLFANVNSATVSDVTIDNMQIVNGAGNTIEYAGGIGAYVRSNAHITGCNVINTTLSATNYCGGIAGKADRSVIDGCTSKTNYIGNVNIGNKDENVDLKITSQELLNKEDAMNSALETSGSNYRFTEGTGDEPLILTKK